jgi:hypothetical protein
VAVEIGSNTLVDPSVHVSLESIIPQVCNSRMGTLQALFHFVLMNISALLRYDTANMTDSNLQGKWSYRNCPTISDAIILSSLKLEQERYDHLPKQTQCPRTASSLIHR